MAERNAGRAKKTSEMERIKRELRKLAFGKPNDCVKLALCEDVDIASLDLSLLTEIRRSDKGTVEVKLLDRTKVLEQLAGMADGGDEKAVFDGNPEGNGRWSLSAFHPSSSGQCFGGDRAAQTAGLRRSYATARCGREKRSAWGWAISCGRCRALTGGSSGCAERRWRA